MKSKIVLFASVFVTVFLLLSAVGITYAMQANSTNSTAEVNAGIAPEMTSADLSQQYAKREASYQMLIAEANQRIETLNNTVVAMEQQKSQAPAQPAVTADKAAQIAIDASGGNESLQAMPELVNYQGKTAFEVILENGPVFVDSQTGIILFNGVIQKITAQQAGEIAGQYLGGMNPKYAGIKLVNLNGKEIYQVTFSGDKVYMVFIDLKGNVIKAQIYQYTSSGGSGGGGGDSSGESSDDDHEEGDDD